MYRLKHAVPIVFCLGILSLPSTLNAQERAAQLTNPEAVIVKYSWSKDRINWESDPFGGPIENFDEMRVRTRNEKRIQDSKRGPGSIETGRAERDALTDQALIAARHKVGPARYAFTYKISLHNQSSKEIVAVDWDYVFFDLMTNAELGRKEFGSDQKIAAGKTKELKFLVSSPPTRRIRVQALDKHERAGLGERIEVVRILYGDGTSWERSKNQPE